MRCVGPRLSGDDAQSFSVIPAQAGIHDEDRTRNQSRQPRAGSARPFTAMPTFLFTLPLTSRR